MEQLPLDLTVDHSAMRFPVKVAFGFGTTIADLTAYTKRVELLAHERLNNCTPEQYRKIYGPIKGIISFERYFEWLTGGAQIDLWTPVHVKYDAVVTLWDNYTLPQYQLDDQDTKEVLDLLRKELCLPEDEQPLWYFISGK